MIETSRNRRSTLWSWARKGTAVFIAAVAWGCAGVPAKGTAKSAEQLQRSEPILAAERVLVAPKGGDAVSTGPFVSREAGPAKALTTASVRWDGENLTIHFDCRDDRVISTPRQRDDANIWRDDCVELFLDFDHRHDLEGGWYHLIFSAAGAIADERSGDYSFNTPGLKATAQKTPTGWSADIVIPWSGLGVKPKAGDIWGLNLNREQADREGDMPVEYPSWSPTHGAFHDIGRWGHIVFADGATDIQAARRKIADRHRERSVDVTVIDKETGKPLPGATVSAMSVVPGFGSIQNQATADKDGRCRVGRLSRDLNVMAAKEGYAGKWVPCPPAPGGAAVMTIAMERPVILGGQAVDMRTGKPVPGMGLSVILEGANYPSASSVKTDENGRFTIPAPSGSTVTIRWDLRQGDYWTDEEWLQEGNGYEAFRGQVFKDRNDLLLKIKLRPTGPLTGRVVNEKGEAVGGAAVFFYSVPPVTSNKDGVFAIKTAPKDRDLDLCAISEDGALAGIARLKAGATEAIIRVQPTRDYDGQAVNTDGTPAADLKFFLDLSLNGRNMSRMRQEVKSNAEGKFAAKHLIAGGTYYVLWLGGNQENRDYDSGGATIDLSKLKAGEPIRFEARQFINCLIGSVANEKGAPLAGAALSLVPGETVPQSLSTARFSADGKGQFTISRLAPGSVTLRISAKGYKSRTCTVPTDSIDFKAVLKIADGPCLCDVTVVDQDGKPVGDAPAILWQTVYGPDTSMTFSTTQQLHTDAGGKAQFRVPLTATGIPEYMVQSDAPGYDLVFRRLPTDEDVELTLTVRKGEPHWRGRVVDEDGKPIAGATIRVSGVAQDGAAIRQPLLLLAAWEDEDSDPFHLAVVSNDDGRFELARLNHRGSVSALFRAPGYVISNGSFNAPRDAGQAEKIFTLSRGGGIKGCVLLKGTGRPPPSVAGARVLLESPTLCRSTRLNAGGAFRLDGVAPGSCSITLSFTDRAMRKYLCTQSPVVEVVAGKTSEVTIEVQEGIRLHGRLVDAETGRPCSGFVMAAAKDDPRARAGTQSAGVWELYLPKEGEYVIQYSLDGGTGGTHPQTIRVEKGRVAEEIRQAVRKTP